MKKRALYYCRVNRDDPAGIGLVRKCLGQVEGLRSVGFTVDMLWLCDDGVLFNERLLIHTPFKIRSNTCWTYLFLYCLMHWLIPMKLSLSGYELFFARYELAHPFLLRFLKKFRRSNPGARMVVEIPSYPYENEMKGFLRSIQYQLDRVWRRGMRHILDFLVTPGYYQELFGLPVITMPNGIEAERIAPSNWKYQRGVLRLVGTGNWRMWHGLDRILNGLEFYNNKTNRTTDIIVKLVGPTNYLPEIHKAIKSKGLQNYVKLIPVKYGGALNEIFDEADLGIGNLGGFRTGLPLGFPLKHREYAIRGVPFIYSMPDPGFQGVEDCLIVLPNDDSPIDFEEVLKKWNRFGKGCREKLRAHALEHFSWKTIMARMVAEIMKERNESKGKEPPQDSLSATKESMRS